jgi:hypothetical protein
MKPIVLTAMWARRSRCYGPVVNAGEIRMFANGDEAAVAEAKARYWTERKRAMTPEEALAVA